MSIKSSKTLQLIFCQVSSVENECDISLACSFLNAVLILDNKIPKSKAKSTRLINDERAMYPRFIFVGFKKFCHWISYVRDSACILMTSHCNIKWMYDLLLSQGLGVSLIIIRGKKSGVQTLPYSFHLAN